MSGEFPVRSELVIQFAHVAYQFAERFRLREFVVEMGVNIVGGCCGTTPEHIRSLVAAVGGLGAKSNAQRLLQRIRDHQ